ncbi:CapA family protein [uncultured Ruminococcus sp.]|uniref:CapA family protein n=1 Tax=uncultured Ruminococcus sp. TaxID=165186 RepID=UPI0025FE29C2|nr:CapA family protein [uncultured Ruminococcus sp.]
MQEKHNKLTALLCAVLMTALTGCGNLGIKDTDGLDNGKEPGAGHAAAVSKKQKADDDQPTKEEDQSDKLPIPEDQPSYVVSLLCAGDNLVHDNIYNEAWHKGGDTHYDFTYAYQNVERYLDGTDIAILNQETLVTDDYGPQSYPLFATPTANGDHMIDIGFNVFSMSNNHVLDMGSDGLISSLDYWDSKNVVHYGAYRDEADSENIRTMEVNGITFAFLGYMEHTNGFFIEDGEAGKVVYLSDEDVVERQVRAANELADVVIVSCHFGNEIENEINVVQETMAPKLVEWGADLIIGTQAHTISTCNYIEKPEGGQAFCYYGLGNFISTMYDLRSPVGLIGKLNVVKDPVTGTVSFENVKAIPIISHFEADSYDGDWYNCTEYPYKEYTDELFERNYIEGFNRQCVEDCLSYIPDEFLSIE